MSGMTGVTLDHEGRLTMFESIPAQRLDAPIVPAPVDWAPLFRLADLDPTTLQPAEPLWTWLAASDTRAAWTGTWPGSGRPLRVEAAALGGRPVAFMLTGPWLKPSRMPDGSPRQNVTVLVLFALAFSILGGATMLARANLRQGRGDWRGATRLGAIMSIMLIGLWLCHVHLVASLGLLAMFLLAVCTSVFYGVLLWTIYVALEPFVRRHWPHVLVSSTNILTGSVRDPVVGRDVLFGAALGVAWILMLRATDPLTADESFASFPGNTDVLAGVRATAGIVLERALYSIRNVLLFFFLLFVLRRVVRSEWGAALIFAGAFALLSALGDDGSPAVNALISFLYFGSAAFVVLRYGLVSFATALFVSELIVHPPATLDASAWYFGNMLLLLAIAVGLTSWAMYTAMARPRPAGIRPSGLYPLNQ
jgi:serine/threonine-protein kinase